jgi:hypothetical protein
VEQNVNQSLKLADRAYVLENGKVVLEGTRKGLAERRTRPGSVPWSLGDWLGQGGGSGDHSDLSSIDRSFYRTQGMK